VDIVTVSLNSTDPNPPVGSPDQLLNVQTYLYAAGPAFASCDVVALDSGLPAGTYIEASVQAGANIYFGPNSLSSFNGPLYFFYFLSYAPGRYTVTAMYPPFGNPDFVYYGSGADPLTIAYSQTITVFGVPEPASLSLLGLGVLGLLGCAGLRRRQKATAC
jgi:hypothetical protein